MTAHCFKFLPRFMMKFNQGKGFSLMQRGVFLSSQMRGWAALHFRRQLLMELWFTPVTTVGTSVRTSSAAPVKKRRATGQGRSAFIAAGAGISYWLLKAGTAAIFVRITLAGDCARMSGPGSRSSIPNR